MFRCVIVALAAAAVRSATAQSLDDFAKAGVQAGIIGPGGVVPAVDLKTLISVTYFRCACDLLARAWRVRGFASWQAVLQLVAACVCHSEGGVVTPYCTPSKPAVSFDPTPAGGLVIDGTQAVTMAQKMSCTCHILPSISVPFVTSCLSLLAAPFYTKDMPQITWTATDSQMYTLFLQDMDGGVRAGWRVCGGELDNMVTMWLGVSVARSLPTTWR
jgi:hypothetical protein